MKQDRLLQTGMRNAIMEVEEAAAEIQKWGDREADALAMVERFGAANRELAADYTRSALIAETYRLQATLAFGKLLET